jgi:hypothetical protein
LEPDDRKEVYENIYSKIDIAYIVYRFLRKANGLFYFLDYPDASHGLKRPLGKSKEIRWN